MIDEQHPMQIGMCKYRGTQGIKIMNQKPDGFFTTNIPYTRRHFFDTNISLGHPFKKSLVVFTKLSLNGYTFTRKQVVF